MIALAYLLSVAVGIGVLAVALRRRPAPATPPPVLPAHQVPAAEADMRLLLAAAVQLASRFAPAA
ncbi:hypothetical protein I6J42_34840 (plasmid) [Streptomyces californicus]|uniref:Uncharacterized protein n=1 Tax=Streptomyces californicus TaxID=67351 RepID=A0ABD7D8W6_9ACTN|nr:hypothetical protein [Streptomyces californicus]QRV39265.1 hypothetical protein I6J42_34840 [Streptomyces californicus]QRV52717.1 hypothetical protein I6J43_34855 [Streptomyces californicus]